jgi:heme/copper-type cytochrome/quinol oxidase subunit 1
MVFSGCFIAFLGFGVWSHHMFATGMGPVADAVFSVLTMLIAIPTGVKIFNWIGTIWGGSIQFKTPMLFAIGFIAQFIIGGLSGVMHASPPADLQQTDTYFIVAHFHYVLFGGAIFGLIAGAYYWFPKMFGVMLDEGIGKLHFWTTFIGMNLTFFPMHYVGLHGMPRRVYTYPAGLGFETMNMVETVGAFILGASFLIFILNIWKAVRAGVPAPADPWNAATLWSIRRRPALRRDHGRGERARYRKRKAGAACRSRSGERRGHPHANLRPLVTRWACWSSSSGSCWGPPACCERPAPCQRPSASSSGPSSQRLTARIGLADTGISPGLTIVAR